MKYNWLKEIEKFCKEERGVILGTRINKKGKITPITVEETKQQIDSCPKEFFWIINIERMRLDTQSKKNKDSISDHLNKFIEDGQLGFIAIDEIHKCKGITSSQSKGILNLNNKASKVGMSGTLLVNNPLDLYCPMSFTGLINMNSYTFINKYTITNEWGVTTGYKNMEELHNILYKSSIRRTKDLLDLPPKVYKQEWLQFNEGEQKLFSQVTGQSEPNWIDKVDPPTDLMAIITRMRQVTVASELLTTHNISSTKFNRLNDILEEARLNKQKVLVFCPFTQALELGLEYCKEYSPKLIKGGMGSKVQEVVDAHEATEGFSVVFAQEATLGVGYTLKNTSIVVFLSPPWSRATYDQCCDRCHRIGQKQTVQIIDLLIANSYDELIYKKLHGKGAMSDVIIDGEEIDNVQKYFRDMGIEFTKGDKSINTTPNLF